MTHQLGVLLTRSRSTLQLALSNGAANHARSLLLELNGALRDLRRLIACHPASDLSRGLDEAINRAEAATMTGGYDEIAELAIGVFNQLRGLAGPHCPAEPLELGIRRSAASTC